VREGRQVLASTPQDIAQFLDDFRRMVVQAYFHRRENRDRIEYVLMEVLDNAHEHGNRSLSDCCITIAWRLGPAGLYVSVQDEGEGFSERWSDAAAPHWSTRGRGVVSIREYADQVRYNGKGNKVTVSFKREENMAEITIIEGRVCIIKAEAGGPVKEIIEALKNALVEVGDDAANRGGGLDTSLFVDLTPLNIINSSLIGLMGSLIMNENIQLLCLCGLQPMVRDLLKRFGLSTEDGRAPAGATPEIQANFGKILICDTIAEGLARLSP